MKSAARASPPGPATSAANCLAAPVAEPGQDKTDPARKVYIKTFGCQMNAYDSQRMADVLADRGGLATTTRAEDADVILLNTCSVREKAQEKLFDELGRLRRHKERDPSVRIGVGGCVASQEGARLLARAPFVDIVFGPQTIHRLPEMLAAAAATKEKQVDISFPAIEKFDSLPAPGIRGPCAFVSVMEGCSKYCSFCVVPYTRGQEMSRPVADVLDEVADLALQGVRDVTLLGQNVNAYLGPQPGGSTADLARLIECVAHIDGIERIRYTTSHPVNFTDSLVEAHARVRKLMPHVHLPVQAGDDRTLARMKRGHTLLEYKATIRKLRAARPGISISSDFIVGFPGETEEQFGRTLALVRSLRFDGGFAFIYSPRPGTPAASLPDPTPRADKVRRLTALNTLLQTATRSRSAAYVGSIATVLVEAQEKRGTGLCGRLPDNRVINCTGPAELAELRQVLITGTSGYVLKGEFLPHSGR